MPKKRVVASLVGNFSPVNSKTASLVRRVRHFRGDIGEELKSRAERRDQWGGPSTDRERFWRERVCNTILEHRGAIQLEARVIGILVFLCVTHRVNWIPQEESIEARNQGEAEDAPGDNRRDIRWYL